MSIIQQIQYTFTVLVHDNEKKMTIWLSLLDTITIICWQQRDNVDNQSVSWNRISKVCIEINWRVTWSTPSCVQLKGLLKAPLHVLNEWDCVEEFTFALGTLLDPSLIPVVLAVLYAVDIVLEWGDNFSPIPVTGELAFAAPAVNPPVELGVVDDGQEYRVWHPLGFLSQHCSLVSGPTRVLVNPKALFVQELEAADLALFDET